MKKLKQHDDTGILADIITYYEEKLERYGSTPRGVDWNGSEGQDLRFEQLCKLLPSSGACSVLDYGCGYGALLNFLKGHNSSIRYIGFDVSRMMIEAAKQETMSLGNVEFYSELPRAYRVDFAVASGLFNVKQANPESTWADYCIRIMDRLNELSTEGFGFNCLTSFADESRKRSDLYYADPTQIFNICMQRYSRRVALIHDYPLFEFTILVRKN